MIIKSDFIPDVNLFILILQIKGTTRLGSRSQTRKNSSQILLERSESLIETRYP